MIQNRDDECCTRRKDITAAREVMGSIDLDPASCAKANSIVRATHFFELPQDGMKENWEGNIFCNPPYSKIGGKSQVRLWFEKLINEYEQGLVKQGILLANVATATSYFQDYLSEKPYSPGR